MRKQCSRVSYTCFEPASSGKLSLKNDSEAPAPYTAIFSSGKRLDFSQSSGGRALRNSTKCSESLGNGRVLILHPWKPRSRKSPLVPIQRIGEKNGTKRHLKCDGNGTPLSICVTGANRHDSPCLGELLLRRILPEVPSWRERNLCLDKWYFWIPSENLCKEYGYTAHIRSRGEERKAKVAENPEPNRRWVVERTNSWFNRFRKLLVRYEKKASSYEALLELACWIITYRRLFFIYG
jgi:transposase